jgi:ribosomal protein L9
VIFPILSSTKSTEFVTRLHITLEKKNENITLEKKEVIRNLYLSGIGEEFIAMQLDIKIPDVIKVLKELDVYKSPN